MSEPVRKSVMMYTEQTPNPESLKFVTNHMLYQGTADFRTQELANTWSPLASALYTLPYVKGVYISNNFVTVTKELTADWQDIMLSLKAFIKDYLEREEVLIREGYAEWQISQDAAEEDGRSWSEEDAVIVRKIKELIDTYVKPAVEMDGGNIAFRDFQEGVVSVVLQGSCSGCPSSTVTLKAGIEGMLKRMVPEVKEVVAEMG